MHNVSDSWHCGQQHITTLPKLSTLSQTGMIWQSLLCIWVYLNRFFCWKYCERICKNSWSSPNLKISWPCGKCLFTAFFPTKISCVMFAACQFQIVTKSINFCGRECLRYVCWTTMSVVSSTTNCYQNHIWQLQIWWHLQLELSTSFCSINQPLVNAEHFWWKSCQSSTCI